MTLTHLDEVDVEPSPLSITTMDQEKGGGRKGEKS